MSAKRLEQVAQTTKTAFVFPGQGSQKAGMLAELAEQFSGVAKHLQKPLEAIGFDLWHIAQSGGSLDKQNLLSLYYSLQSIALWHVVRVVVLQKYLAGHSWANTSALVAAGSLSWDAVKLVNLRGKLMQNASHKVRAQWPPF